MTMNLKNHKHFTQHCIIFYYEPQGIVSWKFYYWPTLHKELPRALICVLFRLPLNISELDCDLLKLETAFWAIVCLACKNKYELSRPICEKEGTLVVRHKTNLQAFIKQSGNRLDCFDSECLINTATPLLESYCRVWFILHSNLWWWHLPKSSLLSGKLARP